METPKTGYQSNLTASQSKDIVRLLTYAILRN